MRHLFIVNPKAGTSGGMAEELVEDIHTFFFNYPRTEEYTIHVTRWQRDAVGYIRHWVSHSRELVRIYAIGGSGTFFEVINGVMGLQNIQVAYYPLGNLNSFVYNFGKNTLPLFKSLRNHVFSEIFPIDVIRAGTNYCIQNCLIGGEAQARAAGAKLMEKISLPEILCYTGFTLKNAIKGISQDYKIEIDGLNLDGVYFSIMIANTPVYNGGLCPAADAHMNDGFMDLYLLKNFPPWKAPAGMADYIKGQYKNWPDYISHHRGKKMTISSDSYMTISVDEEIFFDSSITFEVLANAIDFACPRGVEICRSPVPAGQEPS